MKDDPFAQAAADSQSTNPLARGEDVFFNSMTRSAPQTFGRGAFDNTGIGRPNPRNQVQVTPVPEPSQWAMMLAGLALVGFIVRRNSRKPSIVKVSSQPPSARRCTF